MRELIRDLLYGFVLWFDTRFPKPVREPDEHEDVGHTGLLGREIQ